MNKTAISWSNRTWNAIHGCSKVSDGCKHCYAMKLSLDNGWTKNDWTIQHEAENVLMKPHKLGEPYTLVEPQRVFTNSMSDMFHRAVPDWYRAAMFAVMLDLPQHVFQVLTKRSDALATWDERFLAAVRSQEFIDFTATVKQKKVKAALERAHEHASPWADHIWQGVSVEDGRVLHRIDDLRRSNAHVKFISAEPLLGAWGDAVDLSGIDWIIVGGESGDHMVTTDANGKRVENEKRWMKMEWAREIKRLCVDQGVAYFYKQDSGYRTEQRKYLVEEDGSQWEWQQYPGMLIPPRELGNPKSLFGNWDHKTEDMSFSLRSYIAHLWENRAYQLEGVRAENAAIAAAWWYKSLEEFRPALPTEPHPGDDLETLRAESSKYLADMLRPWYTVEPTCVSSVRAWEVMDSDGNRIFDDIAEKSDALELVQLLSDHKIADPEHAKLVAEAWNVKQVAPNGDVMDVLWKTVLGTIKDRAALEKAIAEVNEPDYADPFDLPANAKVISLWQPYASLMLIGAKQIETRSWQTPFKGTLVIHAAKKWDKDLQQIASSEPFASVLRAHGYDPNALPLGAALGAVILDRCVPVDQLTTISDQERAFGDYSAGRFGWLTSRPRPFREPLPVAGEQGLRDWSSYLAKIAPTKAVPIGEAAFDLDDDDVLPVTTVANFNHVYQHWNKATRQWDDPKYVYIGRFMPSFNLPSSMFANPFKISTDTPTNRTAAIEQYRAWIKSKLADPVEGAKYRAELEALRGKHLVCWCADPDPAKSKACHGDVLRELLGETVDHIEPPKPEAPPVQMSMFDLKIYT